MTHRNTNPEQRPTGICQCTHIARTHQRKRVNGRGVFGACRNCMCAGYGSGDYIARPVRTLVRAA